MINYIFHISDIHIRTTQYHDIYQKQFEKLYSDIENFSYPKENVRIVITGDLFHQKIHISNEQLLLASNFLKRLTNYGKVIIIPGNHDFLENNVERIDSITPVVELLNHSDIIYYKNQGVYEDENIDWVVYSLYDDNIKPKFKNKKDKLCVGLFHGPIQGLSTDIGYTFDDAYNTLNFTGLDLLLCGDIHKRQTFELPDGGQAIMIGSLIQQDFGEKIKHHGYGIYNVENNEYKFYDIYNDSPFMFFSINDISDIENGKEELLNLG